jgi:hypothetical protein
MISCDETATPRMEAKDEKADPDLEPTPPPISSWIYPGLLSEVPRSP